MKIIISLTLKSLSALKPSEYRKFVKGWKPSTLLLSIFKRISNSQSPFRLVISPTQKSISLKTKVPKSVQASVEAKGYSLDQVGYITGYAQDSRGRKVRIGKLLSDPSDIKSREFLESDAQRKKDLFALSREKYSLVISHHPYDIAGMSTDRGWTSCTDLKGDNEDLRKAAPIKIRAEVRNHSIIAYLVKLGDTNIDKPVARALAKKFTSQAGSQIYKIDAVYPNENALLMQSFQDWLDDTVNKELPRVENDYTLFTVAEGVYSDGNANTDEDIDGILLPIPKEKLKDLFTLTPKFLPHDRNIVKFVSDYHSDTKVLARIPKDDQLRTRIIGILTRHIGYDSAKNVGFSKKINNFISNLLVDMYDQTYPLFMAALLASKDKPASALHVPDKTEVLKIAQFIKRGTYEGEDEVPYSEDSFGVRIIRSGIQQNNQRHRPVRENFATSSSPDDPYGIYSYENMLKVFDGLADKKTTIRNYLKYAGNKMQNKEHTSFIAAAMPYILKNFKLSTVYSKIFKYKDLEKQLAYNKQVNHLQPELSALGAEFGYVVRMLTPIRSGFLDSLGDINSFIQALYNVEKVVKELDKPKSKPELNVDYIQLMLSWLKGERGREKDVQILKEALKNCPKINKRLQQMYIS